MIDTYLQNKLERKFYKKDVLTVAKNLLGKFFIKVNDTNIVVCKIVEVEAYAGVNDEASHSFNGITNRNKVMFEQGGLLYIYFTYGIHFCANVVTGEKGIGSAVLLRAFEPILGVDVLAMNRYKKKLISEKEKIGLTNGPGKICQALEIHREHNGIDLTGNIIFISDAENESISILQSKRIGIKKSADLLWRFYIKDNPFVSKR
ncbi:MAG: DNA-3-methyladenine glycosylase [Ignavibacteriales bacterium]|nr:DNA-3-methyladenine glycosylase [Ignavibacteriales bacterium]